MYLTKNIVFYCLVLLIGLLYVSQVGCGRVSRYKVLTFFFEGVPLLDGPLPEPILMVPTKKAPVSLVFENDAVGIPSQKDASVHKPAKDCTKCHSKDQSWGRKQLLRRIPNLCYSCHTDYRKSLGVMHGPIAVGDCLFCHDPHQEKYIHLQKAPQPDLCYQCHLPNDVSGIEEHSGQLDVVCTTCHDPHVSRLPKLIKPYRGPETDPNVIGLVSPSTEGLIID